jgi:hypothetical protein
MPRSCLGRLDGDADPPEYPDRFIARLATKRLSPYVPLADTLVGVQE